MIIGYSLYGIDNDSYMFEEDLANRCDKCGLRIGRPINEKFYLKNRKFEVSYTYDGYLIVSHRFKLFVEDNFYSGVEFSSFELKDYYSLSCINILEFDAAKRETRFINYCDKCGRYNEVIGATPIFLKNITQPLNDGFYRTDLEFGSGSNKHPVIIIGVETYKKIKRERFKGIDFKPIVMEM